MTVDKMQHRPVVIAPGEQAFVMEAGVHLEWHDRDLPLRIISGSDKHVQPLVAARRLLINHLVAVNIEAVGMILKAATETRVEIPLRESNPNVVMPGHSLQHRRRLLSRRLRLIVTGCLKNCGVQPNCAIAV